MPTALPKDRQHRYDELALYVRSGGILTDAYKVEYEIYDTSAGLPGTPIDPGATKQDVTDTDGHFATGCYGVHDIGADAPWTPDAELSKGRVVWYYQLVEGGEEYIVERRFEVLAQSVTTRPAFNMFTAADLIEYAALHDATLTVGQAFKIASLWRERIEGYCRRKFSPQRATHRFEWRVNAHLFLPMNLFALGSFTPFDDTAIPTDELLVYEGGPTGRKKNPRIEMLPGVKPAFGLVTVRPVDVYGVWGYFEPDTMEPPADLVETSLMTVGEFAGDYMGSETSVSGIGPLKREKTDGHEVEYAVVSTEVKSGLLALLRSPALRDQLDMHKASTSMRMSGAS